MGAFGDGGQWQGWSWKGYVFDLLKLSLDISCVGVFSNSVVGS